MSEYKNGYKFETLQLHVGQEQADSATGSRAVPIYQTTSYVFHNAAHAAARFGLTDAGNIYGRLTNSTQDVLEKRLAALEGGAAALATASGAAAITYTIQALAQAGDHIVAQKTIYGGSYNLLAHTLPQFGVTATFVDAHNLEELTAAILRIRDKLEAGLTQEAGPAGSALDSTYHERIISSAKQYLTAHLTDASLEEAAISVNLSPGYFSRLFHKVTGETFSDYLTGCRMKKAAEYLHGTNYKTYEISLMVGYDNPKNFTRAFKQYYHVTPREFRDNR